MFDLDEHHLHLLSRFDQFIDSVFIIDIILMFFTSYLTKIGREERRSQKIAERYVFSKVEIYAGLWV